MFQPIANSALFKLFYKLSTLFWKMSESNSYVIVQVELNIVKITRFV